jgi:hypothetical protein
MDGLLIAVVTALFFDHTNGLTTRRTRWSRRSRPARPPNVALFGAALLNVVGALISTHVAATAKGIVSWPSRPPRCSEGCWERSPEPAHLVVGAASSSSHRLMAAVGAVMASAASAVQWAASCRRCWCRRSWPLVGLASAWC